MEKYIDIEGSSSEWRITPEELRSSKGFESLSDEEAEKTIDSLVQLAIIAYYGQNDQIVKEA